MEVRAVTDTSELTSITGGEVDLEKQELRFTLSDSQFRAFNFTARVGVAEQILAGLGRMCTELRKAAIVGNVRRSIAAEDVAVAFVQRERLHDKVLLQLITPSEIPYTFALDLEAAVDISERLKIESEKDVTKGSA